MQETDSDEYEYCCTGCNGIITSDDNTCPHCGSDTSELIESSAEARRGRGVASVQKQAMQRGQVMLFLAYVLLSVSLFFVGISWMQFHWFWALCFAVSGGRVLLIGISEVKCLGFSRRRLSVLVKENSSSDQIRDWLSRNRLDKTPVFEDSLFPVLFLSISIMVFYYFPWSPSSTTGQIGRVVVCLLAVFIFTLSIGYFVLFLHATQRDRIRVILERSSREEDRSVFEQLVRDEASRDVAEIVKYLRNTENPERADTVDQLVQIGYERVEPLLKDYARHVRLVAVKALGRIGDPRAVQPLMGALQDQYPFVQEAAATALDQIGLPETKHVLREYRKTQEGLRATNRQLGGQVSIRSVAMIQWPSYCIGCFAGEYPTGKIKLHAYREREVSTGERLAAAAGASIFTLLGAVRTYRTAGYYDEIDSALPICTNCLSQLTRDQITQLAGYGDVETPILSRAIQGDRIRLTFSNLEYASCFLGANQGEAERINMEEQEMVDNPAHAVKEEIVNKPSHPLKGATIVRLNKKR